MFNLVRKESETGIKEKLLKVLRSRQFGYCSEKVHQNFILIFGCPASKTVNADTNMVEQMVSTLVSRLNRDTLKLVLPTAFELLRGTDSKIEMTVSNTI